MGPGATGDYFPGHWDPSYAAAQGQPTIYANSLFLFGLLDKAALSWCPGFITRRAVRLAQSLYAGDTVTVSGTVASLQGDLVELSMAMTNQDGGVICTATVSVRTR